MPAANIFKNSTHYWIFGGVMIAYWLYSPSFKAPQWSDFTIYTLIGLWMVQKNCFLFNDEISYFQRKYCRGDVFEL